MLHWGFGAQTRTGEACGSWSANVQPIEGKKSLSFGFRALADVQGVEIGEPFRAYGIRGLMLSHSEL